MSTNPTLTGSVNNGRTLTNENLVKGIKDSQAKGSITSDLCSDLLNLTRRITQPKHFKRAIHMEDLEHSIMMGLCGTCMSLEEFKNPFAALHELATQIANSFVPKKQSTIESDLDDTYIKEEYHTDDYGYV